MISYSTQALAIKKCASIKSQHKKLQLRGMKVKLNVNTHNERLTSLTVKKETHKQAIYNMYIVRTSRTSRQGHDLNDFK